MPQIGRDVEQAKIEEVFDCAESGAGGTLVIAGPAGVGKSELASWSAEQATARGWQVLRSQASERNPGLLVWARLLRSADASEAQARRLVETTDTFELDAAADVLAGSGRRLILVDDIDRAGQRAIDLVGLIDTRLAGTSTVVIVTTATPIGIGQVLRLGALDQEAFATMLGMPPGEVLHAAWRATRGIPRPGLALKQDLTRLPPGTDPVVHLALHAVSTTFFLQADAELVRLLETALSRAETPDQQALLSARLARELIGDPTTLPRRRRLIDDALTLAAVHDQPAVQAEVLDARLHALWDPAGVDDRLKVGAQISALAAAGDPERERQGIFWQFIALMQLGQVAEAEAVLARYLQLAQTAADTMALTMGVARQAMLDILRGRFDEARARIDDVADLGGRARVPDLEPVLGTLRAGILRHCGSHAELPAAADALLSFARWSPGHFYEATAARILADCGRTDAAQIEIERLLPQLLTGSGPRWLTATADLAVAAATVGDRRAAERLYDALMPFEGQLVIQGGAVLAGDPVDLDLGLTAAALGRSDDAVKHLENANRQATSIGALPAVVNSARALAIALEVRGRPGDRAQSVELAEQAEALARRLGMPSTTTRENEWSLVRDGQDWLLDAGPETARLRDNHGLRYLRMLLGSPGRDISSLDLISGGTAAEPPTPDPMLDDSAREHYRARLADLSAELDEADRCGDQTRAERANAERDALVQQLRRGLGLSGRARTLGDEAERARVNVTRSLRRAIDTISAAAPLCGAYLDSTISTGRTCRYAPGPAGPPHWRV